MEYNDAKQQFIQNYGQPSNWTHILSTGTKPLHAYTVFDTKEAAQAYVEGEYIEDDDEVYYSVYPGMLICVTDDSTDGNNGLYEVVLNPDYSDDDPEISTSVRKYTLNKYYDAATVDSLLEEFSGQTNFINVEDEGVDSQKLVYFTGVDKSATHTDSSMYIVPTIAYDKDGTLFSPPTVHSSDVRLKDHIEELDVDLGKVGEIDKVKFTWKDNMNGKRQIGTTAQSLETIFPELVYTNPETGYKAVNYEGLSVIALAAIDKLYARVRELENTVRKLTKEQQ